jgi:hypothetical protein
VALLVATSGCTDTTESLIVGTPAALLRQVIAAMAAQPRMVLNLSGGSIRRAVIDTRAQYLALFSGRKLLLLQKRGVGYRLANGCYQVSTAFHFPTESLWAGTVDDITSDRYSARLSGTSLVYRSARGEMTVDSRSKLLQSARSMGLPSAGVAATSATFSYPPSVNELPSPGRLCP